MRWSQGESARHWGQGSRGRCDPLTARDARAVLGGGEWTWPPSPAREDPASTKESQAWSCGSEQGPGQVVRFGKLDGWAAGNTGKLEAKMPVKTLLGWFGSQAGW